nr:zinc ribbon domain-containing protein [Lachnospiraceae bacterium]
MHCTNCGQLLEEGALFCTHCGAKVELPQTPDLSPASADDYFAPAYTPVTPAVPATPVAPVTPRGTVPSYGYYTPQPQPVTIGSESPVRKALHDSLSSPSFLVVAILLTVQLILTLVSVFTSSGSSVYSYASSSRASYTTGILIGTLLVCAPLILYVIGTWIVWGSSKGETVKGAGCIKAASIIMIVVIAIIIGVFTVVFIAALSALGEYSRYSYRSYYSYSRSYSDFDDLFDIFGGSAAALIIVFSLLLVLLVLILIYFIKMSGLASTIRQIDTFGVQRRPVSSYLNFIHMTMFVFSLLGILFLLLFTKANSYAYGLLGGTSAMTIISSLVSAALWICLFIAIHNLKRNLEEASRRGSY